MKRIGVGSIIDGMELARDIPASRADAPPLLRAGTRLSWAIRARLVDNDIHEVWIEEPAAPAAQQLPDNIRRVVEHAVRVCEEATAAVRAQAGTLGEQHAEAVNLTAADISEALSDYHGTAFTFADLDPATVTHSHSVRAAILGMLIGQRAGADEHGRTSAAAEARLAQLGAGLMLLEVSTARVPEEFLTRHGELAGYDDADVVGAYVEAARKLLDGSRMAPVTLAVLRDHYEHFDGTGLPSGLAGAGIHPSARIAAVADTYAAITAERHGRPGSPAHVGVRAVLDGAGTRFDPAVVEHFKRLVMPYPVGQTILLPDDTEGTVAAVNLDEPERPTVRYTTKSGQETDAVMHISDGVVQSGWEPEPEPGPDPDGDRSPETGAATA
jgi:HD-GYP domain-containing protein (c-di-GMP phosphodiesterase class II)